jgi:hypothetical protein
MVHNYRPSKVSRSLPALGRGKDFRRVKAQALRLRFRNDTKWQSVHYEVVCATQVGIHWHNSPEDEGDPRQLKVAFLFAIKETQRKICKREKAESHPGQVRLSALFAFVLGFPNGQELKAKELYSDPRSQRPQLLTSTALTKLRCLERAMAMSPHRSGRTIQRIAASWEKWNCVSSDQVRTRARAITSYLSLVAGDWSWVVAAIAVGA